MGHAGAAERRGPDRRSGSGTKGPPGANLFYFRKMSKGEADDFTEAARLEREDAAIATRRRADYPATDALVAAVRVAGGTWKHYLRYPRVRLLALRALCSRGRARPKSGDPILARLFPWRAPLPEGAAVDDATPPRRRARPRRAAAGGPRGQDLPKEVAWLVLSYWRSSRDAE